MTPSEIKAIRAFKKALGARLDDILKSKADDSSPALPELDTPFASTPLHAFSQSFRQRHGIHPYDALLKPPAGVTPDEIAKALILAALEKRASLTQDAVTGEWKPGGVFKREMDPSLAAENEAIAENAKIWATKAHRFQAAEWTTPNGHPRCVLCGDEEPVGGWCNMPAGEVAKLGERIEWGTVSGARYSGTIVETDGNIAIVRSDDGVERLVEDYITKAAYMRAALAVPAGDGKIWAVWINAKPNADGDGFRGWALPGGHIEAWEKPEAAAVREFAEETGRNAELNGDPYPDLIEDWATTRIFPGVALPGESGRQDEKVKAVEPWQLKESERQALAAAGWANVAKAEWIAKAGDVVAFDFDATMTQDEELTPNPQVVDVIRELLTMGVPVRVLSARAGTDEGRAQIVTWLEANDLAELEVTDAKTPDIRVIVDDRALHWEPGTSLSADKLARYRSWFEKAGWEEHEHPRDDDGKFSSSGGAGGSSIERQPKGAPKAVQKPWRRGITIDRDLDPAQMDRLDRVPGIEVTSTNAGHPDLREGELTSGGGSKHASVTFRVHRGPDEAERIASALRDAGNTVNTHYWSGGWVTHENGRPRLDVFTQEQIDSRQVDRAVVNVDGPAATHDNLDARRTWWNETIGRLEQLTGNDDAQGTGSAGIRERLEASPYGVKVNVERYPNSPDRSLTLTSGKTMLHANLRYGEGVAEVEWLGDARADDTSSAGGTREPRPSETLATLREFARQLKTYPWVKRVVAEPFHESVEEMMTRLGGTRPDPDAPVMSIPANNIRRLVKHEGWVELMKAIGWDESKHPRASDGRFGNVAGTHAPKAPKTPKDTPAPSTGAAVGPNTSQADAAKLVEQAGGRLDGWQDSQFPAEAKRGVKWLWWTHPKTGSSSLWKIDPANPMTVEDMKADLDRHVADFEAKGRDNQTAGDVLPWHSPENRKKAAEIAEHKINDTVVYKGGSRLEETPEKPGIAKGERFVVTGYNGTNKDESTVYYRLRSLRTGKPQILAAHYLVKPGEGAPADPGPPAPAPAPAPKPEQTTPPAPKPPKPPKRGRGSITPPPAGGDVKQWRADIDAHYKGVSSSREVGKELQNRVSKIVKMHLGAGNRAPYIDFSEFHPVAAQRVASEVEHLAHEFPEAVASMTRIDSHNMSNPSWWGSANMSRMSFGLNSQMFGPGSFNAVGAAVKIKSNARTGWHPANCDTMESIVAHEFGHLVEGHYFRTMSGDDVVGGGWMRTGGVGANERSWQLKGLDYEALATASQYARVNRREAFAESFSDYVMWRRQKQRTTSSGRAGGDRTAEDFIPGQAAKTYAARTMEDFLKKHHSRIRDL